MYCTTHNSHPSPGRTTMNKPESVEYPWTGPNELMYVYPAPCFTRPAEFTLTWTPSADFRKNACTHVTFSKYVPKGIYSLVTFFLLFFFYFWLSIPKYSNGHNDAILSQKPQNWEFPNGATSKNWRILSLTRLRADPVGRQSRTWQRSLSFSLPGLGNSISARHIPLPQIKPTKSPDPGVEGHRDLVPLWNFRKKELGCPKGKRQKLICSDPLPTLSSEPEPNGFRKLIRLYVCMYIYPKYPSRSQKI